MNDEIIFRSAKNADTKKIKNLVFGVLAEYGLTPDTDGIDADLDDIESNYINRGGVFEILEDKSGEILGTVGLFPLDKETIELRKMYFDKRLRGRGIGKKTLERMIETARRLGYKTIHLETASVLKAAIGLYKKYGFQPTTEGLNAERCDAAFTLDI
jgi:putative acetyltransferase